ncbi:MAG: hypothetical protein WAX66_00065 [Patescibacteria group bacterium]
MEDTKDNEIDNILNFPDRVSTGNGYANDLTATTNDRLGRTIRAVILLSKTFETESKHIRGSVRELDTTIKSLDKKNSKLQMAIVWLAVITALATVVQIVILFISMHK